MGIDNAVTPWFTDAAGNGNISTIEAYSTTNIQNFWWLIIGIGIFGCVINLIPGVKNWVAKVEKLAQENLVAFEKEHGQHSGDTVKDQDASV